MSEHGRDGVDSDTLAARDAQGESAQVAGAIPAPGHHRCDGEVWQHRWVEEYYGNRCADCGLFFADGCAPWDDVDEYCDCLTCGKMENDGGE